MRQTLRRIAIDVVSIRVRLCVCVRDVENGTGRRRQNYEVGTRESREHACNNIMRHSD